MQKFSDIPYKRPSTASLYSRITSVTRSLKAAETFDEFKAAVMEYNALQTDTMTAVAIASVRNSIDTADPFYEKEKEHFDTVLPMAAPKLLKLYKAMLESPFRAETDAYFGPHFLELIERQYKTMSPKLIALTIKESALNRQYQKLLASCKVVFQGEERNISGLNKFLRDKDRSVRKAAANALGDFFGAHREELDSLYDELVAIRDEMGKKLGYDDYVPLGYMKMGRTYSPEDVAEFRRQVVEYLVPVCTELRKRQAARIGADKLKYYDEAFDFKSGNPAPDGDEPFMVAQARRMYHELSPETGKFFDFMVEYGLMDLVTKPNKRVGGYCTSLPKYGAPFIFSNFNGTSADVDVLTHEAGHAFAGMTAGSVQELLDFTSPTLEACEIHSMSMEFFTHPWMELFFGEDADKYRYAHLEDSLLSVPYMACVDEFQFTVYSNPSMTPAERRAKWKELERLYLPHRDYDGQEFFESGGFWQKQHHIYTRPFYYIDYALASMSAFEFYGKIKADRAAAWEDYLTLCRAGGSAPYRELLKIGNLSDPLLPGGVEKAVAAGVKTLLETDDTKL